MRRLPAVINSLLEQLTREALLNHMEPILKEVGVDHFSLHRLSPAPGIPFDEVSLGQRVPQLWEDNFLYQDDPWSDPILQKCKDTIDPFFFSEAADPARLERARGFGVGDCLVVPIAGPRGIVGAAWMAGDREKMTFYKVVISAIAYACYYRLEQLGPTLATLPEQTASISPRERQVLDLVADGLTTAEIGLELGISKRTAEWHLARVVNRLGARNRVQAVVLAIRDGMITVH